ncbi:glycine--tRNA ligase subunit beta [Teredinibacter purpureus]|uniref:glycine--tRNA ligase subunit beta n=1 Tax=Teredinibacter purpureus TaxID=2731756 RepID=UPI0005F85EAE|nr:glycine--tRNA ligase subunit beta [Teredinibacter purpureus]
MSSQFLVELGTEELPPTALKTLSNAFVKGVEQGLKAKKLAFDSIQPFATPRRLAMLVNGLANTTPKEDVKVWGPPAKIAFDAEGNPTKAAEAFAKKNGLAVSDLTTENDGKIDKLVHNASAGGEAAETLLCDIVSTSLANLPINKRMRWGASRTEFVRPVHWLVMMLNDTVLNGTILGVTAGNTTRGHRFHCNQPITLATTNDYPASLADIGHVMADYDARKAAVVEQVNAAAHALGGNAVISEDLLHEVTSLVEFPVALAGKFDESFLSVPAEALISSMKEHQKYFHVVDNNGQLLPHFITLSNIVSKDPAQVIDGNERVIRPRLADAAFFFDTDKKTNLTAQRERLKTVVFQAKLGTIYEKTERIEKLGALIASKLGADTTHVTRAAKLCKSDLVSSMVYEFPDMQGIAGYHYAQNDGEHQDVAQAMQEQYMPKFAGDALPSTATGAIIALADRLDTITGIFGIGQKPTGSKDPFALRRASLGALRILVEKDLNLDLRELINAAASNFSSLPASDTVEEDVIAYMIERFKSWYEEAGISAEVFQAVSAKNLSTPLDINQRVYAVAEFSKLPEAQALAAANKRVSNILAKLDHAPAHNIDSSLLVEPAEKALATTLAALSADVKPLINGANYTDALKVLAALREPVDTFFDDVMVMTDDLNVRENRLALLHTLRQLFLEVADISLLAVKN